MSISPSFIVTAMDSLSSRGAIINQDGTIVHSNQAWEDYGNENGLQDNPRSIGLNYLEVCQSNPDEDSTTFSTELTLLLAGKTDSFKYEYPLHTPTSKKWFLVEANRFTHKDEVFVLVVHIDITDRKIAEIEAEETAERLTTVTELMAHDLRNPLTVALGRMEVLENETDDNEHIKTSINALERMENLLQDALVLARSETITEKQTLSLKSIARDAWKTVPTEQAQLHVHDDATVLADKTLFKHLLENLFRNAVTHGGNNVTVQIGKTNNTVYIEDNGTGFEDKDGANIFTKGYTTSDDGTGIGLAIVSRIINAHGWKIEAKKSNSGGARFEILAEETQSINH